MIPTISNLILKVKGFKNLNNGAKVYKYYDIFKNKFKSIEVPEKLKGTVFEKWLLYWRDILKDYTDVTKDALQEVVVVKPWKGVVLLSTFASTVYFVKTNPDERSFRDTVVSYSNDIIFVGPAIRNPEAVNHLKYIEKCYNEGTIRRVSLGLFSIIWVDNYNKIVGIYKALCPFLKPEVMKMHEKIVDVGFCNKWWIIDRKMLDVDVNPEEWGYNKLDES